MGKVEVGVLDCEVISLSLVEDKLWRLVYANEGERVKGFKLNSMFSYQFVARFSENFNLVRVVLLMFEGALFPERNIIIGQVISKKIRINGRTSKLGNHNNFLTNPIKNLQPSLAHVDDLIPIILLNLLG